MCVTFFVAGPYLNWDRVFFLVFRFIVFKSVSITSWRMTPKKKAAPEICASKIKTGKLWKKEMFIFYFHDSISFSLALVGKYFHPFFFMFVVLLSSSRSFCRKSRKLLPALLRLKRQQRKDGTRFLKVVILSWKFSFFLSHWNLFTSILIGLKTSQLMEIAEKMFE